MEEFDDEEDVTQVYVDPRRMVTRNIQLVRPLGRGGMGQVWLARHHGLRADVVVKFMAEHLTTDASASGRFALEAETASLVKSPHVVQVLDHGIAEDGRMFIAMELLEGADLAAILARRRKLVPAEVVTVVAQVARALSKAHERAIVHRDIKPENVFVTDGGGGEPYVKVLDFGIAKSGLPKVGRETAVGAMLGTPNYMAPEQIVGAPTIGPSADLWSLGVVAFEMLTGTQPFVGETVGAIAIAICTGELPMPSARNPALPRAVDAWFARACARKPEDRFRSALEMADALRAAALSQSQPASQHATTVAREPRARLAITTMYAALAAIGALAGMLAFSLSQ